jgi:hypothetical protein
VIDRLGNPNALTLAQITNLADGDFGVWIRDRKNRRAIPHRLENCGYVPVRNNTSDGHWKINDKRVAVYAKSSLPLRDQLFAAQRLACR